MGKAKKTRKYAVTKKIMSHKDTRVRENAEKAKRKAEEQKKKAEPKHVEQANSALFFQYNTQLGPPYHVLVDTNFINFSIRWVHERERERETAWRHDFCGKVFCSHLCILLAALLQEET